jgi:predicted nucleic acid-binding protein
LLDTNIVILRASVDPDELPDEMAISAITLAELSAGPHQVRSNAEQTGYDEHAERARRLEILQRAENEFDPIPFDAEAARIAIAEELPLFTTNPKDFAGLDSLLTIVPVNRPDGSSGAEAGQATPKPRSAR